MTTKIFQIVLGSVAGAYVVGSGLAIAGMLGNAREAESLGRAYAVFGSMISLWAWAEAHGVFAQPQ